MIASVLGVSACSSSTETSNKPAGFTDKVKTTGIVPADWKDGSGWVQDKVATDVLKTVLAIGDNTGYLAPDAKGPGFHLVVVDGKGTQLYASKDNSPENVSSMNFARVLKDDKSYWVMTQTDGKKEDAPDAKKSTHVVIVDESGKEVISKTLDGTFAVNVVADAVLVLPVSADAKTAPTATKIIDVSNGDESPMPTRDGNRFAGRFNGVDVFVGTDVQKGGIGKITDGKWTIDTSSVGLLDRTVEGPMSVPTKFESSAPTKVGNFLQVERVEGQKDPVTGVVAPLCDLINPKTGKPATNAGGGQCMFPVLTSPNGTYIYFGSNGGVGNSGLIDMSTGKTHVIINAGDFTPSAISDDGAIYGKTINGSALFNLPSDDAPRMLTEATSIPVSISKSGLAAFLVDNSKLEFVVKKEDKK